MSTVSSVDSRVLFDFEVLLRRATSPFPFSFRLSLCLEGESCILRGRDAEWKRAAIFYVPLTKSIDTGLLQPFLRRYVTNWCTFCAASGSNRLRDSFLKIRGCPWRAPPLHDPNYAVILQMYNLCFL